MYRKIKQIACSYLYNVLTLQQILPHCVVGDIVIIRAFKILSLTESGQFNCTRIVGKDAHAKFISTPLLATYILKRGLFVYYLCMAVQSLS